MTAGRTACALAAAGWISAACGAPRPQEAPGPPAGPAQPTPPSALFAPEAPSPTPDAAERLYEAARSSFLAGDNATARGLAQDYLHRHPDGPRAAAADAMLESIEEGVARRGEPVRVGALLPLTGRFARYGRLARLAIELAVARHNAAAVESARVEAVIEDTGGDPARAASAASTLASGGCACAIGPLTASELSACAPVVEDARLPLVAPAALGRSGSPAAHVFAIGVSPEVQGRALARVASSRRYRRVALLHPATPYGSALAEAIRVALAAEGVSSIAVSSYAPGQTDFTAQIRKLGGTDAKRYRDAEEREKNLVHERAEAALAEILGRVSPELLPPPTPTPLPRRARRRATPTPSPSPTHATAGPAAKIVFVEFVSEDAGAEESMLERKFGSRLALLIRQHPALEVLSAAEWYKLAADAGHALDLLRPDAEESLLRAARALSVTHLVSGSVASAGGQVAVRTHLFDVNARRTLLSLSQYFDAPAPRIPNPAGLDAIVIAGRGNDVLLLAAQLVFYDLRVPFLGTADWDPEEIARARERALAGSAFPCLFFARSARPEVRAFSRAFSEAHALEPDLWAALTYDAATIVLGRIAVGARTGRLLLEELSTLTGHRGVTGGISFQGAGEARRAVPFVQVKEGGDLEDLP